MPLVRKPFYRLLNLARQEGYHSPARLVLWCVRAFANSGRAVTIGLVVNLLFCDTLFEISEGKSLGTSVWWLFVTASTAGYGDTYAITPFGRMVTMYLLASMVVFTLLIGAHITKWVFPDLDRFTNEEQRQLKVRVRQTLEHVHRLEHMVEALLAAQEVPLPVIEPLDLEPDAPDL